jgi:hypothetical protein
MHVQRNSSTLITAITNHIALTVLALNTVQQNGGRIAAASNQRVQALQEGLGAIRDVLLYGRRLAALGLRDRIPLAEGLASTVALYRQALAQQLVHL